MTRHFSDEEKLFVIKRFLEPDDNVLKEQLAEEFNCQPEDIQVVEWSNNIEYSGISGWKDKLIRTLGAIGAGLGFGAPGLTLGAFIGCAAKGIAFNISAAGYGWLAGGFAIGFVIGLPVGWRTTTPIVQKINDWGVRAYNKLTNQAVDLVQVEHDLANSLSNSEQQGLNVQGRQSYGSYTLATRQMGNYEQLITQQQQTISDLTQNNDRLTKSAELLTKMLDHQTTNRYTPQTPSSYIDGQEQTFERNDTFLIM